MWLGGTLLLPGSEQLEQARTLLGPEKTSCVVFLGTIPGLAGLTRSVALFVGVCSWWRCGGWGVVVC